VQTLMLSALSHFHCAVQVEEVAHAAHVQAMGKMQEWLATIADDWEDLPTPASSVAHSEHANAFHVPEHWAKVCRGHMPCTMRFCTLAYSPDGIQQTV
jgi:hypothetical protein